MTLWVFPAENFQEQRNIRRGGRVFPDGIEWFSYDFEMKTREQNRNNKRTEVERFHWFIERKQTRVAFGWLSERSDEKNFMPENFLEINRYFALTPYCNTSGQSSNAFSILGFSLAGKRRVHVLTFFLAYKRNNKHLYENLSIPNGNCVPFPQSHRWY